MAFRIVKITSRCKLELELNYLVIRKEDRAKVSLDEISILIIENQQVCITSSLLSELIKKKIRVIFTDSYHNPIGEIEPYSLSYNKSLKILKQINWDKEWVMKAWTLIILNKITNQYELLKMLNLEGYKTLEEYKDSIEFNDATNREGIAARKYFSSLFGSKFERRDDFIGTNKYLNYGYQIILSAVNREIAIFGYLNNFGIHHRGETNPFNLGCDFMEPFRPFVDKCVKTQDLNEDNYKYILANILNESCVCDNKEMVLINAIHVYVQSLFTFLEKEINYIYFVSFYEQL